MLIFGAGCGVLSGSVNRRFFCRCGRGFYCDDDDDVDGGDGDKNEDDKSKLYLVHTHQNKKTHR